MMDTIMPDAEPVEETMEPEPTIGPDVMVYTGSTWWIDQMDATTEAEITKSQLESEGIQAEITEDENVVRDWMLLTTGNGNVNILITYGVIPNSIYGAGNTQPDGSIAENWIETTDGDTILNHANYLGYVSTEDPEAASQLTDEELTNFVWSNDIYGLRNLMDNPDINLFAPIPAGGSSFGGYVSMIVTSDGIALTPGLANFESNRAIPLNQLQGEWFAEKVFASDTGDDQATYADPVIVRDGNRGGLALVHATWDSEGLSNGEVAAEIIINYLLTE